jgi:hypothetical protein
MDKHTKTIDDRIAATASMPKQWRYQRVVSQVSHHCVARQLIKIQVK